ncbi:MAG: cytochrome o ubiquinol oxidase subunit IV [Alphaproteobacteria bacterium]|nr:cytochrome o ubiquinol oxidase subunit IV [Alphaproteobacteria bacterium]MDE2161831.1 cytochrome o ubiquinol oxidase subunit IV [Alphaproteobacteria bacterium]MDE2265661.1 cytochrome o ubiquinol oxidase subunit IV [Alphaproteobacteria bacterium]MDE2499768.1 cytochrome o ubiquinol oxidase subunit IV [Alphaproteobacteria bacterium]
MNVEAPGSRSARARISGAAIHPGHAHHGEASHGSVRSYLTGFALSVVLTAIPFVLVMTHALPAQSVVPTIIGLGLVQIIVHLIYFLHMNGSSSQVWNNAAFVFTLVVVGILVCGSLWIMYHLNVNMMPGMMPGGQ